MESSLQIDNTLENLFDNIIWTFGVLTAWRGNYLLTHARDVAATTTRTTGGAGPNVLLLITALWDIDIGVLIGPGVL